jgi:hypothetical protein
VQTTPEFLSIFKNSILSANLDIADHPAGEVLVNERADRCAGTAVETFKRRVIPMFGKFLCKVRVYQCHIFLPGAIMFSPVDCPPAVRSGLIGQIRCFHCGQFVAEIAAVFFRFLDFAVFLKGSHIPEYFRGRNAGCRSKVGNRLRPILELIPDGADSFFLALRFYAKPS